MVTAAHPSGVVFDAPPAPREEVIRVATHAASRKPPLGILPASHDLSQRHAVAGIEPMLYQAIGNR
jgi:hypothetical protein